MRRSARILPPVWHGGAVHDLVRLVRHPVQRLAAARARRPPACPCTSKFVAELRLARGRRCACAPARARRRAPRAPRRAAAARSLGVELRERRVRRDAGAPERVVGVAAPDARRRCAGRAATCGSAGCRRRAARARRTRRSRARGRGPRAARRRRARAPTTRPCARCRTRARAAGRPRRRRAREAEPHDAALAAAVRSSAAPRRRPARPATGGRAAGRRRRTRRRGTCRAGRRASSDVPDQRVGRGDDGLQRREAERVVRPRRPCAADGGVEALGQRLHLGQLGHRTVCRGRRRGARGSATEWSESPNVSPSGEQRVDRGLLARLVADLRRVCRAASSTVQSRPDDRDEDSDPERAVQGAGERVGAPRPATPGGICRARSTGASTGTCRRRSPERVDEPARERGQHHRRRDARRRSRRRAGG